mgnify:CR=1 FL=1
MIKIYGASDDLVEIEAGDKSDEIGCYDNPAIIEITDIIGQGARFIVEYGAGDKPVWRIGVEPLHEDIPIPWQIEMKLAPRGYSTLAVISADPNNVTIEHVNRQVEDDE